MGESASVHPPAVPPGVGPAPAAAPFAPQLADPADLVPPPTRRQRLAWYAGAVLFTTVYLAAGLRLDRADFTAPFVYAGDALLILPMVKATAERGSHWRNERMGYPGVQELHDFPVVDHLHFAILWGISRVFSNVVVTYNLYYLLTYPLTTLVMMAVFRRHGLTLPAAAAGAVLYAFLPYHYQRGEAHYFLSAYWLVPVVMDQVLLICRGRYPFFVRDGAGPPRLRVWRWNALGLVVLGGLMASAGAYYAFFACALYAAAGLYGLIAFRDWRAPASAALLIAVMTAFGVVNHLPSVVYRAQYGSNPVTARTPEEADLYGIKLAQLVFPISDHNLTVLARVRSKYASPIRPCNNENECSSLGVVAAAGFIGLVGLLLLPTRKRWPFAPLTFLTGFILLLSVIGGFGSVFNLLVFDQVRCYNRISVFLAVLCYYAVFWPLDRFLLTRTSRRGRQARYPVLVGVFALGLLDQTPYSWFREKVVEQFAGSANRFRADAQFYAQIEAALGPGGRVFNLPYIPYPEYAPLYKMDTYEHARGYVHTSSLFWSFGAIKGREVDAWQNDVSHKAPDELLRRVVFRGFDGIYVDKRGYFPGKADALIAGIKAAEPNQKVRVPVLTHPDGMQVFLDLRQYRDWLRDQNPAYFEAEAKREREWVALCWMSGFVTPEYPGNENRFRWCGRKSTAVFVNPGDEPRTFRIGVIYGTDAPGEFRITVDGGEVWSDEVVLDKPPGAWEHRQYGLRREYLVRVPPGRHPVVFRCQVPDQFMPNDHLPQCYFLMDFEMKEVR